MTALPWQIHWLLFRHNPLRTIGMWVSGWFVELHRAIAPEHYHACLLRRLERDPEFAERVRMHDQVRRERRSDSAS